MVGCGRSPLPCDATTPSGTHAAGGTFDHANNAVVKTNPFWFSQRSAAGAYVRGRVRVRACLCSARGRLLFIIIIIIIMIIIIVVVAVGRVGLCAHLVQVASARARWTSTKHSGTSCAISCSPSTSSVSERGGHRTSMKHS